MRHCHFFYVSTYVKWKTCNPFYFSSLATVIYSLSVCLYETNFPYEEGYSAAHSIFEAFVQQRKDHFGLFLNKHVVEEAKILIKFIVVDSYIVHEDAPAPLRPHLFKTPTP